MVLRLEKTTKRGAARPARKTMAAKAVLAKAAPKRKQMAASPRRRRIRQTLSRFVVVATTTSNAQRDTANWTAELTRVSTGTVVTANFDDYGVAQFSTIPTLTTVSYRLAIINADGTEVFTRTIAPGREVFVARF